jgi:hypothetical protein
LARIEWVAVLLTGALIVGLFVPIEQYGAWARRLGIDGAIDQLSTAALGLTKFLGASHEPVRRRSGYSAVAVMQLGLGAVMLLGIGWCFVCHRKFENEKLATTPRDGDPNVERLGLYLGLFAGLGLSIQYGLKGVLNTYGYDEKVWDRRLQQVLSPIYLVLLLGMAAWILVRSLPRNFRGQIFPHAAAAIWLVLFVQNAIAQAITGPLTHWQEVAFNIYYVLLFAITAVTVVHFQSLKELER